MQPDEFSWPVRVYIEDTDAGGIVYYVNYLKFMERARTEYLRSFGHDKAGANKDSYQFVVVSADIKYQKPAYLDDELRVTTTVVGKTAATLSFVQRVWRQDMQLSEAQIRIACVNGSTLKPMPIPPELTSDLNLNIESK